MTTFRPLVLPRHLIVLTRAYQSCWICRTGEGDRGQQFGPTFDVLGVRAELEKLHLTLANKPSRVEKFSDSLGCVMQAGAMTRDHGQILLGLLRFAAGYYGGRTLKHVCSALCAQALELLNVLPSVSSPAVCPQQLCTSSQMAHGRT